MFYNLVRSVKGSIEMANSVNPDQTAPNEQSDQGLHDNGRYGIYFIFSKNHCPIEYPRKKTLSGYFLANFRLICRECSGLVVECLTRDRRAAGSSLIGVTALWSLSKTHLS